jgi:NADH-quinone oxidoreductase subunit H
MITILTQILALILPIISIILPLLIAVAYLTLAERKLIAAVQGRIGPHEIGFYGLLQPLADGLKLLLTETILPSRASQIIFLIAPIITFSLALITFAVLPLSNHVVYADLNLGILYIFGVSALGVYGIILAGWASNSRYAFLGALRSAAQMISYEVSLGLIVLTVIISVGSLNLSTLVNFQQHIWLCIPFLPLAFFFFISGLAETNRPPFDLPEAEAELVAGYYVEYSSMGFALFFLGEMANIIFMSTLTSILFLGGWLPPFQWVIFQFCPPYFWLAFKVSFVLFLFIMVRAAYPRYRYDQLMNLCWLTLLPLSLGYFVLVASILISFDYLPY